MAVLSESPAKRGLLDPPPPPTCIRHCIGCYKCALYSSVQYDGPSVKEKINSSVFSLPFIGERNEKIKGHDCNNREMLPMAIFILLDIYDLLKKSAYFRKMLIVLVMLLCQTCPYYDGATYIKPSNHNKKNA